MQIEQLLCWSGMTDTEHSTTSSSNEEEDPIYQLCIYKTPFFVMTASSFYDFLGNSMNKFYWLSYNLVVKLVIL